MEEKQQKSTRWDQAETRRLHAAQKHSPSLSCSQTGSKSVFKEAGTGTSCLKLVAGEGDLGQACLQTAVILG